MSTTIDRDEGVREAHATDASGLRMMPEGVARPTSVDEVAAIVREAAANATPVTAAGSQTSTTAASISDVGIVLSLRGMDRIIDLDAAGRTMRVEAGALVGDVKRAAAAQGLLFAPDPTSEDWSTVGGAVACNASGARTLRYGATRAHVRGLTVVLASGEVVELRRTPLEKNTVGFQLVHDPVDWFIGSEGTLGVVVAAELALLPLPPRETGLGFPFTSEADALRFVVAARTGGAHTGGTHPLAPRCLEYFDAQALGITRSAQGDRFAPPGAAALVYAEDEAEEPDLDAWLALAEECGALTDEVRVFDSDAAIKDARDARHAVPATMNERGARQRERGGRKVSTDWAVPYRRLHEAVTMARELADEAGVPQAVLYGHAGNGHPHQNFIAGDATELARIEKVVEATLKEVIAMGGTVAAEHGIGKLKRKWIGLQLSPLQLGVMRAVKRELDPGGMMAPGNVL